MRDEKQTYVNVILKKSSTQTQIYSIEYTVENTRVKHAKPVGGDNMYLVCNFKRNIF